MKFSLKYMVFLVVLAAAFTACRKEIVPADAASLFEMEERACEEGDAIEGEDCDGDESILSGDHPLDGDDEGDDGINDGDGDDEDDEGGDRRANAH